MMSVTYISAKLRRLVVVRAERVCEYCLIAEEDTFLGCAVDHIVSEKHGGRTRADNLALACVFCNQAKGSDLGSVSLATGELVRFFNPRTDRWNDHFAFVRDKIKPLSVIGEVTARILGFNVTERVLERKVLRRLGRYPNSAALNRMK